MGRKLFEGARGAVSGFVGAARHVSWYLSYCVDGSSTRPSRQVVKAVEATSQRRAC